MSNCKALGTKQDPGYTHDPSSFYLLSNEGHWVKRHWEQINMWICLQEHILAPKKIYQKNFNTRKTPIWWLTSLTCTIILLYGFRRYQKLFFFVNFKLSNLACDAYIAHMTQQHLQCDFHLYNPSTFQNCVWKINYGECWQESEETLSLWQFCVQVFYREP